MYKNDPEFRKTYHELDNVLKKENYNYKRYKGASKYTKFNSMILPLSDQTDHGAKAQPMIEKYYSHLKEMGYGAIEDANDRRISPNVASSSASMVFDRSNIGNVVVDRLDQETINAGKKAATKNVRKVKNERVIDKIINFADKNPLAINAGVATNAAIISYAGEKERQKKKKSNNS